jgi:predicted nucleic acid-binding Zn ribbon protein
MTPVAGNRTQAEIELRAKEFRAKGPFSPEKTIEELFGPADDWMFTIGPYQLILIPAIWQWWFYDRIHDSWEDTGYDAGEVMFTVNNGELMPARKKRPRGSDRPAPAAVAPAGTRSCPACGSPVPAPDKFCSSCGAPVPVPSSQEKAPAFCPGCGRPVSPEEKFCSGCGARISPPAPSVPQSSQICLGCGNPLKPGAKFCRICGKKAG